MVPKELIKHQFTITVLDAMQNTMQSEEKYYQLHGRKAKYVFDEHEYYMRLVGHRTAVLLSFCEQLSYAVQFFSTYRETQTARRAGISRTEYLRYMIENYIMRTHTLHDLVLKLICAVFNITRDSSKCKYSNIKKNVDAKNAGILEPISELYEYLTQLRNARHEIVHGGNYQDDDLYGVELNRVLEKSYLESGDGIPDNFRFLPDTRREETLYLSRKRKEEYIEINAKIFRYVASIFDILHKRFITQGSPVKT